MSIGHDDSVRFESQIIDLYVGHEKRHFSAHQAVLELSPQLASACKTQSRVKGNTKTTITLSIAGGPIEFGHLLEYLYTGRFSIKASNPPDEADQLAELYLLGSQHELPKLQEEVISLLESSQIAEKIKVVDFFTMAENLYNQESDVLRKYFAKVAPRLVESALKIDPEELQRMVSDGGTFAIDLFKAQHDAFISRRTDQATPSNSADAKMQDSEDQQSPSPTTPSPKVRSIGDCADDIPASWYDATDTDRLLVKMRNSGDSYEVIHQAWQDLGYESSIRSLLERYERIHVNMAKMLLKPGEENLLIQAETEIEAGFYFEKWDLVAKRMASKGTQKYGAEFVHQKYEECIAEKAKAGVKEGPAPFTTSTAPVTTSTIPFIAPTGPFTFTTAARITPVAPRPAFVLPATTGVAKIFPPPNNGTVTPIISLERSPSVSQPRTSLPTGNGNSSGDKYGDDNIGANSTLSASSTTPQPKSATSNPRIPNVQVAKQAVSVDLSKEDGDKMDES